MICASSTRPANKEPPTVRNENHLFSNRRRKMCVALLLFSFALLASAPREGKSAATTTGQRNNVVVFAVSAESGEGNMDAVVIVDGKILRAPFTDQQKVKQKSFANQY